MEERGNKMKIMFTFFIIFLTSIFTSSATCTSDFIEKSKVDTFFFYDEPDSNFVMTCNVTRVFEDSTNWLQFELSVLFKRSQRLRTFNFKIQLDSVFFKCNEDWEFVSIFFQKAIFKYPQNECLSIFGDSVSTSNIYYNNELCFLIEFENTVELVSHGFHLSGLLFSKNLELIAVRINGGSSENEVLFNQRIFSERKIDMENINLIKFGLFYNKD